jgi:hypothetical protein
MNELILSITLKGDLIHINQDIQRKKAESKRLFVTTAPQNLQGC